MKRHTTSSGTSDVYGIFTDAGVFLLTVGLLFLLRIEVMPAVGPVTMATTEKTYKNETMPLFEDSKNGGDATVVFSMRVAQVHPRYFSIKVDDCIQRLRVNGQVIIPDLEPVLCSPHSFARFPLGKYLKTGDNTLSMDISDIGVTVGIDVHPSATDPLMLATLLAFVLVGFWFLWNVLSFQGIRRSSLRSLLTFFFVGTSLRILYVIATPYGERSHDTSAHLDYIRFVMKSWTIPHAGSGWEYHQAPLYYYFSAAIAKVTSLFGIGFDATLAFLQGWSLLFSIASLGVLLCSIHFLFSGERRMSRWVAGALVTVLPGAVYFSSRITNEALSAFLSFVVLFLLLHWWKDGKNRFWYAAWAVTAVMFVTKINALLFVPILLLCFLLRKGPPLTKRLLPLFITLFLFAAATAWLPVLRFMEPNVANTLTLGNKNMDKDLTVKRGIREFLAFNPVAMAKIPFNDSWKEQSRRSNFFEYFFRSAFFGEFEFKNIEWLASVILILAYLLVLPLLVGVLKNLRRPFEWLPLHLTAGATCIIALLYAIFFPYAPNQDFRQSILLLLPAAYYLGDGITLFPRVVRHMFVGTLLALSAGILTFVAFVYINS